MSKLGTLGLGAALATSTSLAAEGLPRPSLNLYGTPGLVDMPNATSLNDADLTTTIAGFGGVLRYTLAFQISPRLTGAFRYAYFGDADDPFSEDNPYWDRSFDIHYRFLDEGRYRPALALGMRDIVGTGLYSSEYIVATKTLTPGLRATVGLGWGRLAGRNTFDLGLGDRPPVEIGSGGTADFDQYFRGPAAVFGGLEWQATDDLSLAVEYSSDAYEPEEDRFGSLDPQSPINASLSYAFSDTTTLGAHYLYGDALGVSVNITLNPTKPRVGLGLDRPPPPFVVRPDPKRAPQFWGTEWTALPNAQTTLRTNVSEGFDREGLRLVGLEAEASRVTVSFENPRYGRLSQAIGRAARVLSDTVPASIDTFVLVPVVKGMPTTAVTLPRATLEEELHNVDSVPQVLAATGFSDALSIAQPLPDPDLYPRFRWSLGAYTETSFFDPRNPLLIDFGAQLRGQFEPVQGLVFDAALRQKIVGNLDEMRLIGDYPDGAPPLLRSDAFEYAQYSDLTIPWMTAELFFRPAERVYGRVTAGLLERMYGGISGELLWQSPHPWLALGVELNHVRKRDYDQRFTFQDYSVTTGHASAYVDFGKGYRGQLDVGRYLAGDHGATFSFERGFDNGWNLSAYATLTDVGFDEFGEGSFDKGINITIPMDALLGNTTRARRSLTIQPILRDGGARLSVRNRLHKVTQDTRPSEIAGSWGRFWR